MADGLVTSRRILSLCVLACLANIVLVTTLAGAGVLHVAEKGDVSRTRVETTPHGDIVLPEDSNAQFVVERPTDVDAYYDAAIRVRYGHSAYNPWGHAATIQRYHYHPLAMALFVPLSFLGYAGFKAAILLLSLAATVGGTVAILAAEVEHRGRDVPTGRLLLLGVASLGFAPMVTNYKVGQVTPFMYLALGVSWWALRSDRNVLGGASLVVPSLLKPYFLTPLVLFGRRERWRGIAGFAAAVIGANLLAILLFGVDGVGQYYEVLWAFATTEGSGTFTNKSLGQWHSTNLFMLFWFGQFAPVVKALLAVPFMYLALAHILDETGYYASLFSLSLVTVLFVISNTQVPDVAMLLGAFLVLGIRFYGTHRGALGALGVSFILMQAHPYYLEFFADWGVRHVAALSRNRELLLTLVPIGQPGMWGLLVLYCVACYAAVDRAGGVPPIKLERWRQVLSLSRGERA